MSDRNNLWMLAVTAVLLLGCAPRAQPTTNGLTDGVTFQPVDAILESPLEITNFADDGSASLPIHTTVPVACSVVYGKTPAFGSLSLDQDMAGGTHSDHNPVLFGLEPETTYYFRVQGVDDQGVVYLSEVMTFTTPPRDTQPVENLASAARGAQILGYSSAFGGAAPDERWGAGGAFDNNPNTEWSSAGDGDEAWIEVELERPARIERVEFQSRAMADGTAITLAFTITTERGETFGPFEIPDVTQMQSIEVDIEAQRLRFDLAQTTGGNTGVVDIAVYGTFIES